MTVATIPYLPTGTVYGTLLNFEREWRLWEPRMADKPYGGAPKAPVLYVKTANCFSPAAAPIGLPVGVDEVEIGASLALEVAPGAAFEGSFGPEGQQNRPRTASIFDDSLTLRALLLADLSLPHASYYRPPVKFRNLDGFLGLPEAPTPLAMLGGLDGVTGLTLELRINGELRQAVELSTLRRTAARLLAEVNEFQTLRPGDVLMLGTDCLADGTRPRARVGDRIEIRAPGLAPVRHEIVREAL